MPQLENGWGDAYTTTPCGASYALVKKLLHFEYCHSVIFLNSASYHLVFRALNVQ